MKLEPISRLNCIGLKWLLQRQPKTFQSETDGILCKSILTKFFSHHLFLNWIEFSEILQPTLRKMNGTYSVKYYYTCILYELWPDCPQGRNSNTALSVCSFPPLLFQDRPSWIDIRWFVFVNWLKLFRSILLWYCKTIIEINNGPKTSFNNKQN